MGDHAARSVNYRDREPQHLTAMPNKPGANADPWTIDHLLAIPPRRMLQATS